MGSAKKIASLPKRSSGRLGADTRPWDLAKFTQLGEVGAERSWGAGCDQATTRCLGPKTKFVEPVAGVLVAPRAIGQAEGLPDTRFVVSKVRDRFAGAELDIVAAGPKERERPTNPRTLHVVALDTITHPDDPDPPVLLLTAHRAFVVTGRGNNTEMRISTVLNQHHDNSCRGVRGLPCDNREV